MVTDLPESFARAHAAAGALFFDAQDRVLLVMPSYKDCREIPGGFIERGETPKEAAAREVREELGIAPPIGRLLVADWAPDQPEGDKVLFVFDGGVLSADDIGRIRLDPAELTSYEFHEVGTIHELTIARLARRIIHSCAARADGTTRYLEHGEPVG
ncbi:NUDIX domain-containing protein [Actinomadura rudentiformis]|uniref:NUDIX hydrolase n=1 Tax=Actinomadura rudentiformis TaxID=359158 RepID=A0A6H9YIN8_9ACTN|nr:NUDIX hydrolase [Actinomadura rudentiformis]KAB2346534.1 NUDIX hydrolase [Actinomadura rudentiformis]